MVARKSQETQDFWHLYYKLSQINHRLNLCKINQKLHFELSYSNLEKRIESTKTMHLLDLAHSTTTLK